MRSYAFLLSVRVKLYRTSGTCEVFYRGLPFPANGDGLAAGRLIVFFCGKRYKFQSDTFRDQRGLT